MIKYLLVLVPLVLVGLYSLSRFMNRPPRYRRRAGDDLSKFFNALLNDEYETGLLMIEPDRKRFVQFRLYSKDGERGVEFGFPLAPWSEHYYESLNKILYQQGVDYHTVTTGQNTVVSFIIVDLKQDLVAAMHLSKLVLLEVFKLKPEDKIRVSLST